MVARRTKEEALATRNRLLDAAELLFQAQGVSQTTLQQIAQQAGATRGAIYWHFKDKADLFNAMMERVILPLEAPPKAAAVGHDDPLAEIEEGMVHALTLMTTDPQVRRVFDVATHKVEYTHDMASVQQRHLDARNACVGDFEKALRLAARRARIRLPVPGSVAAQGLHALISGLIQNWLLDPAAFDLVPTGRRTFRVYLAGLGFARQTGANGAAAHEAETAAA
ncbi:TetR family transcriptional regulator [Variovorax paradoxus]|uniref:TetR family transcriptional regulator n=1 Tax=Variovorax TaxID=34072 RepID=UPI0006E5265D|nr:TetR family transcriptional regulator [Variovorax sp.]KPU89746.1 TetR family transcriptional regulator [Variovorax paradoxus]KPU90448.1 TetR family transcriptional regulator [Variovorax paradoxus]KPU90989.1 TetR family transcriptional regulator [Variovorax paradoxus]KPV12567.1 TetR family transcriptional regulator [Variovorax paradoxus]KPV19016.1 TetR family transcriptional regulator [Variovorax paradoxus]